MRRRTPRTSGLLVSCQLAAQAATLSGNSRPQFPHLENGFGLPAISLTAQGWLVKEQSKQLQDRAWETPPLTLASGSSSVKWAR